MVTLYEDPGVTVYPVKFSITPPPPPPPPYWEPPDAPPATSRNVMFVTPAGTFHVVLPVELIMTRDVVPFVAVQHPLANVHEIACTPPTNKNNPTIRKRVAYLMPPPP
jgi:hypothetical protein